MILPKLLISIFIGAKKRQYYAYTWDTFQDITVMFLFHTKNIPSSDNVKVM